MGFRIIKNITLAVCCFLFACLQIMADEVTEVLAQSLFEEGCYHACMIECERALSQNAENPFMLSLREKALQNIGENKDSSLPPDRSSYGFLKKTFLWLITFYKSQISPALGERCSLYPSCSTYGMEAVRKHGLLGLPMTADRLIREPSVIRKNERLAVINGKVKYLDPVSDHDFWLIKKTGPDAQKL